MRSEVYNSTYPGFEKGRSRGLFHWIPHYEESAIKGTSMRKLRSQSWFGGNDKDAFIHRSWMKNQGIPHDQFDGRPVIGICNTWSELTPCNAHFRELAEYVRRGVLD